MKFTLRIFDNDKRHYLRKMTIEASTLQVAKEIADLYWNKETCSKNLTIMLDEVKNDSKNSS